MPSSTVSAPLVVEPAGEWIGIDGNWSSFPLGVGTPMQPFLALPATGSNVVWVPLPEGCYNSSQTVPDCGASRGVATNTGPESKGFNTNASSTWSQLGLYGLPVDQELFSQEQNGLYGLDSVSLGNSQGHRLQDQILAGISSADVWLGSFGLGARPVEFSELDQNDSSLLASLKDSDLIPSLSYGYHAGASYRSSLGSLVLGGFDDAAFERNDVTFVADVDAFLRVSVRDLVVANSLIGTMSPSLEETHRSMLVDSAYSDLWLPPETCSSLAQALNLTLDPATGRYLVDPSTHSELVTANPQFTFTLAANESSTETMNLVFPYSAFDHQLLPPVYKSPVPYFPIRQAPNGSDFILGRTFLQEAYIVVDWERGNFTIGQAVEDAKSSNIVKISPPPSQGPSKTLGGGPLAGIIVGAVAGVSILAAILWYLRRSRARRRELEVQEHPSGGKEDLLQSVGNEKSELSAEQEINELQGGGVGTYEIESTGLQEMHGDAVKHMLMSEPVFEMDSGFRAQELETGGSQRSANR